MFKNKRIILILIALLLTFSLVSCGSKDAEVKDGVVVDAGDVKVKGKVTQGFGVSNLFREDMGEDEDGNPRYSFNQIFVNALFDEDGKIVDMYIDQLEVATPNTGDGTSKFNGFPGVEGYKWEGQYDSTEDVIKEEVESWRTKRELKEEYKLESGTWTEQMAKYEETFKGMTVDEVIKWSTNYTSSVNMKPLKSDSEQDIDKDKYEALSDEEKEMLDDVTSVATISLNDGHGNILIAIKNAYNNRKEVEVKDYYNMGIGMAYNVKTMPMQDEAGNAIYSINEVVANLVVDKDGKISSLFVDQQEIFSGNMPGETSSKFSGFPTQIGFGDIGVISPAISRDEVYNWKSKRALKEEYKLESGTWEEQMLKIEESLIGKNADEVKAWAEEYKNTDNLVSGATISVEDENGMIIDAILNAFGNLK